MTESMRAKTLGSLKQDEALQFENYQVVSAIQALLGQISANMVAISLECERRCSSSALSIRNRVSR